MQTQGKSYVQNYINSLGAKCGSRRQQTFAFLQRAEAQYGLPFQSWDPAQTRTFLQDTLGTNDSNNKLRYTALRKYLDWLEAQGLITTRAKYMHPFYTLTDDPSAAPDKQLPSAVQKVHDQYLFSLNDFQGYVNILFRPLSRDQQELLSTSLHQPQPGQTVTPPSRCMNTAAAAYALLWSGVTIKECDALKSSDFRDLAKPATAAPPYAYVSAGGRQVPITSYFCYQILRDECKATNPVRYYGNGFRIGQYAPSDADYFLRRMATNDKAGIDRAGQNQKPSPDRRYMYRYSLFNNQVLLARQRRQCAGTPYQGRCVPFNNVYFSSLFLHKYHGDTVWAGGKPVTVSRLTLPTYLHWQSIAQQFQDQDSQ